MRGGQTASASRAPCASISASSAEPVSAVDRRHRAQPPGSRGMAARAAAIASRGCGACITPGDRTKRAPSASRAQASTGSKAAPAPPPALPAPRRGSKRDRSRDSARLRRRPRRLLSATASITALASRVSGMRAGSICCACASHSSAIKRASGAVGAVSGWRAGVNTGLPSSSTAKPSSALLDAGALVETLAQNRPHAAACGGHRVERLIFKNLGKNLAHRFR